jgi:hypothetical protein
MTFLVHVLVGDGIYTNNKAGRIVLAESWRLRVHEALCYLLILVVCGNHQANLSLASAVQGKIANTAFRMALTIEQANAGENFKSAHTQVCGVAVRLSKYLINDYSADGSAVGPSSRESGRRSVGPSSRQCGRAHWGSR